MKEHLKLSFIGIASWWILLLPFDYTLFDWIFKTVQKPFIVLLKTMDRDLIFETDTYGTYVLIALSVMFPADQLDLFKMETGSDGTFKNCSCRNPVFIPV